MTLHIYGDQLIISKSIADNIKALFVESHANLRLELIKASFVDAAKIKENDLVLFLENSSHQFNLKWFYGFKNCGSRIILLKDNLQMSNLSELFENGLKYAITTFDSNLIFRDVLLAAINNHPSYYSPTILNKLINPQKTQNKYYSTKPSVTEKETRLISLFWNEKNKFTVAEEMNVSVRTVESYRSKLIFKLNKDSFLGVVKYAIKEGLID